MTIEASKILLDNARKDFSSWKKEINEIKRISVVYTSWYPDIIDGLKESAEGFFQALEIPKEKISFVKVSGSWELPLMVKKQLEYQNTDFVVTLGCVVKGETPHFDILCQSVATELMRLQVDSGVPLGFGVLTVNNVDQAKARADKGAEAAEAALRSWIQLKGIGK